MNRKHVGIVILTLLIIPILPVAAINTSNINKTVDEKPHDPLIEGPTRAKYGELCNYTAVSTDPQEDELTYEIQFSDSPVVIERGPKESGKKVDFGHAWNDFYQENNPYKVRVKAIDSKGYESDYTRFITIITNDTAKDKDITDSNLEINPLFKRIINYIDNLETNHYNIKNLFRYSLIQ